MWVRGLRGSAFSIRPNTTLFHLLFPGMPSKRQTPFIFAFHITFEIKMKTDFSSNLHDAREKIYTSALSKHVQMAAKQCSELIQSLLELSRLQDQLKFSPLKFAIFRLQKAEASLFLLDCILLSTNYASDLGHLFSPFQFIFL